MPQNKWNIRWWGDSLDRTIALRNRLLCIGIKLNGLVYYGKFSSQFVMFSLKHKLKCKDIHIYQTFIFIEFKLYNVFFYTNKSEFRKIWHKLCFHVLNTCMIHNRPTENLCWRTDPFAFSYCLNSITVFLSVLRLSFCLPFWYLRILF